MTSNDTRIERLLTEKQVASTLSVSVATLRRWRSQGKPPEWLKLGGNVRYRPEVIRRYLALASSEVQGR